jgi:hypothetical protein
VIRKQIDLQKVEARAETAIETTETAESRNRSRSTSKQIVADLPRKQIVAYLESRSSQIDLVTTDSDLDIR